MSYDRIEVIDVTGKLCFTQLNFKGSSLHIDLSSQAKGIYFLKLLNSDVETIQKLIKQ